MTASFFQIAGGSIKKMSIETFPKKIDVLPAKAGIQIFLLDSGFPFSRE
jgi:hypothetical protein